MSNGIDNARLLVPIHIDALLVGKSLPSSNIFQWTNLAPDFARLQGDYLFGSELEAEAGDPFTATPDLLEPGTHLHFRLPRALTHGTQTGAGDIDFLAIPNRWLVQRFGGSDQLSYSAWLIRSDGMRDDAALGITWPTFHKTEAVEFKKIGACSPLAEPFVEINEAAAPKIRAVGPGNPAFSAYYPACWGVLGFYDPMTDVPLETRLSYLVTGWYSDVADDPLTAFYAEWQKKQSEAGAGSNAAQEQFSALQEWAKERAWTGIELPDDADLAPALPSRLLCHGLVRGIVWDGPTTNYFQQSDQGAALRQPTVFPVKTQNHQQAYKIAVGSTPAEALAALLAPGEVDQDLLTALQGDILSQPVTSAELQVELHERRFGSVHGGTQFLIRPDTESPAGQLTTKEPKQRGEVLLPAELQMCLNELNARQQVCDHDWRRVEDCRWLVYALWYLWTNECKGPGSGSARAQAAKRRLDMARAALATERSAWESARDERDKWYAAPKGVAAPASGRIVDELAKYPKTRADGAPVVDEAGQAVWAYRLSTSSVAPFHTPNEPGIALSGPALTWHNSWQPNGALACRISGQTVTGINLQIPSGDIQTVGGQRLGEVLFPEWSQVPVRGGIHGALLWEAILLDEANATVIAGLVSKQYQSELAQKVRNLQNPYSPDAESSPAQPPNRLVGHLPDPVATFDWRGNPWIPLYLVWEVGWQSDYPSPGREDTAHSLTADTVIGRWQLRKNVGGTLGGDLVPTTDRSAFVSEQTFSGHSLLTATASRSLAERLARLDSSHPLVNLLKSLSVQSQTLDGFNDALILQKLGMQLPPLDFQAYWKNKNSVEMKIDPIHEEINIGLGPTERQDTFRTAPELTDGPLFPIRSGRMRINKLSLVDAFGQTLKLPVATINASVLETPENASLPKQWDDRLLHRAHSCVAEPSAPKGDGSVVSLRPRFARPMRLRIEWVGRVAPNGTDRGPVCGWILPNHLEKSLMVFSATGKPLGALQRKLGIRPGSEDPAFYWVDVPAGTMDSEVSAMQPIGERLAALVENVDMRYFCEWALRLSADAGAAFSGLIDKTAASADQLVPDEDPGLSVLVGRPLVLVRADLRFEIAGLPTHRPRLRADASADSAIQDGADAIIDSVDYQRVQWPVRLGDIHARNDGLIGAFRCVPTGADFVTSGVFYPAWGHDDTNEVRNQSGFSVQDFTVDCLQPLAMTLLMDPLARVHATSGVLPRVFAELRHETATGAKRVREVFFQTAPVLGHSPTPQMPRPSDDYGEWSWAYRPDVTHWQLDPTIVETTDRAAFSSTWPAIAEGWLKLAIAPVKVLSFWVREGTQTVASHTRIHLAWSLQGAESVRLEQITDDGAPIVLVEWNTVPLPTEYGVTVKAETLYRITASATDADDSVKELNITIDEG